MAYATANDVLPLLGDLTLPSSLNVSTYVDRAAQEIDLVLGARYVSPLSVSDAFTVILLKTVNSELAAAQIFLSQASGGEDNRINAYGKHLWDRAMMRLAPYLGDLGLPGNVLRPDSLIDSGSGSGPVAIYHEDSVSPLETFYRYVESPGW